MFNIENINLETKWSTALSKIGLVLSLDKKIEEVFCEYKGISIDEVINTKIDTIEILTKETGAFVGWDQGKVVSIQDKKPFSEEFGSCIAILMRAYRENENQASFLGLHHFFIRPEEINNTIKDLIKKIENSGSIQIFLSGGNDGEGNDFEHKKKFQLIRIIRLIQKEYEKVKIEIKDDTIYIAPPQTCFFLEDGLYYRGTPGLSNVGFDKNGNPYQIIDIRFIGYKGDFSDIEQSGWF